MSVRSLGKFPPFQDGDVFFWSYRQAPEHMPYYCKSRIVIARNGFLRDTFWSSGGDSQWSFEDAVSKLDLEFKGNMADLEKIPDGMECYYDDKDIVNLNHPNSSKGNIYKRAGSKRSKDAMLSELYLRLRKAESDKDYLGCRIADYIKTEHAIASGEDLERIHL